MSFSAEVERMHTAIDAALGVDAVYRPAAGVATPCKVERFRPEPEFGGDLTRTPLPDELLRVSKSALPKRPVAGDVFELTGGVALRVLATPATEDDDGKRWTVKVETA